MLSEAPGASSRNYPGSRAFADPGTASSAGFLYNGVSPFGVCGTQQLGTNDYNYPGGNWGTTFTEVQAGEVLDVSWCVNADHGGVYQFRLCDKPELVAKLWADGPMSSEEQEELEQCYQDGILPCDSATNDCSFEIGCEESWGCAKEGLYFHCGDGVSTKACAFHGNGRSCSGGVVAERKVLIPRDFPTGNTVLTWRWDSHDTTEVFAARIDVDSESFARRCSDITITPAERTPTQSPVEQPPAPSPTESVPGPAPGPPSSDAGYCCWWGPNEPDRCNPCQSQADPTSWCGVSQERCESCGNGVWCSEDEPAPEPEPSPAPIPAPTVAPTEELDGYSGGGDYCCFEGGCTMSCYAPVFSEYHCGQSVDKCEGCGGVWCYDLVN